MIYNIYRNGKRVAETTDKSHLLEGLDPSTEYTLGVSVQEGDNESEIVNVLITTPEEPTPEPEPEPTPPFDLIIKEASDRFITVKWDSDEEVGAGRYNIYLDDVLTEVDFAGREHTFKSLEPMTEYKVCVSTVTESGETSKVTITAATTAPIGEEEPELPALEDLQNILHPIGAFEEYDEEKEMPVGWEDFQREPSEGEKFVVVPDNTWYTQGETSAYMEMPDGHISSAQYITTETETLAAGYYIIVVDYKTIPQQEIVINIGGEDELYNRFKLYLSLNGNLVRHDKETEGALHALYKHEKDGPMAIALGINDLNRSGEGRLVANFDAIRLYKIEEDLYNYIKGGKMHDARVAEILPYLPADDVEEVEESDYFNMTVPEIKARLDELGVDYKASARKAELIELLEEVDSE